jgi:hypothetical protein
MSEPCAHERDYTTAQAMKSYVDASVIAGNAARERDKALADAKALRATLAKVAAIVADPHAALVVDRIRTALKPTDQTKGKP